jgi:hypothetical protein
MKKSKIGNANGNSTKAGRPAVWDIRTPHRLDVSDKDAQSGL